MRSVGVDVVGPSNDAIFLEVYNLLTQASKTSCIDTFLDRVVKASCFVDGFTCDLEYGNQNWFLD